MVESTLEEDNWMPLEANPVVVNEFITKIGFETIFYKFYDVISIDEFSLAILPQPVQALIFLFDETKPQRAFKKEQKAKLEASGQFIDEELFYMKQYAKNACGTIAAFHVLLNFYIKTKSFVTKGTYLDNFLNETSKMTPEERGKYFLKDEGLKETHKKAAKEGQSKPTEKAVAHFIGFVPFKGHLYELDGGKFGPINHGECTDEEFLFKAIEVIKQYIERDPTQVKFSILALAPQDEDVFGY
mmetsp:Transcript_30291/g.34954  ORF Transcript_30291/g.34954 Transcript_30291/m.34954 type:complete len:243 (+) Transcript_30291:35-763(+)